MKETGDEETRGNFALRYPSELVLSPVSAESNVVVVKENSVYTIWALIHSRFAKMWKGKMKWFLLVDSLQTI